jgi:pimeloyl-ACP methyl ester carboxylesterase
MEDIRAAWLWLRQAAVARRFGSDAKRLVLGGYSFGGGMAMAYAAQDPSVQRVVAIACPDLGEVGRQLQQNPAFAEAIRRSLWSTRAPEGPARFDVDAILREIVDSPEVYGLRENAANLADRAILLIGGWEDEEAAIELFLLPLYRALRGAAAAKATFLVYHTDHDFGNVRQQLASDIGDWLLQQRSD